MSSEKTLRIGLIGAGAIAEAHAEALAGIPGVSCVCTADLNRKRLAQFRHTYGTVPYTDYREMATKEMPDAVVISLPHALHEEAAVYCLNHGISVLLEKPMANTSAQCKNIIHAAEESGAMLMIGHIQHYFPENNKAKELICSGKFGKLASITDIRNIYYFTGERPKWFFDRQLSGGGILLNYGAHSLDKIQYITGLHIQNITGKTAQQLDGFEIEGNAQLFVQYEQNVTAVISYCGYKGPMFNETTFYMTEGVIRLQTGVGLWASTGDDFYPVPVEPANEFRLMWEDFIHSLRTGAPSPIPGECGLSVVEAIEQVYNQ